MFTSSADALCSGRPDKVTTMTAPSETTVSLAIDDGIAAITIQRAASLNSLNSQVLHELEQVLTSLQKGCVGNKAYHDVRVVTLTGAGDKAFVAGADIKEMGQASESKIHEFIELGQRVMHALEELPLPVIAIVNGFALGGGLELALGCDIIIASSQAKLGLLETSLGLIPGFGGTQRLMQRVGVGGARRLIFSAETISASEAHDLGLVDILVQPDQLATQAQALAESIKSRSPIAVAAAKTVLRRGLCDGFEAGLRSEVETFIEVFRSADTKEGLLAFREKRKPIFQGK